MNPAKYTAIEYINFLIATQKAYSCSEAEHVQPTAGSVAAHDAINRLLYRLEPDPNELWQEAKVYVELEQGIWSSTIRCSTNGMPNRWTSVSRQ